MTKYKIIISFELIVLVILAYYIASMYSNDFDRKPINNGLLTNNGSRYIFINTNEEVLNTNESKSSASSTDIFMTDNWKIYRNDKYGFEIMFPPNWSFYESKENHSDSDSVSILSFVDSPDDEPWGDSFIGYVDVFKDAKNFMTWFNQEGKFGAAGTQRMLEAANSMYEIPVKEEDFSSGYANTNINGFPAIVEITKIVNCPIGDNSSCYFLGGPKGYEENWFIFKGDIVIMLGVQTYEGPIDKLNQIISSIKSI